MGAHNAIKDKFLMSSIPAVAPDAFSLHPAAPRTPCKVKKTTATERRALENARNLQLIRKYQRVEAMDTHERDVFANKALTLKVKRAVARKLDPFALSSKAKGRVEFFVNAKLARMVQDDAVDVEMFECRED